MTTRLFNPGPSAFVSLAGGVFAAGEHFDGDLKGSLKAAVDRGRLLLVDVPDAVEQPILEPSSGGTPVLPPVTLTTDPDGDEITEVESTDEIVVDDDLAVAPKPGPPAKKATTKTAPAEKD